MFWYNSIEKHFNMENVVVLIGRFVLIRHQEETASPVGSDKVAEEEGEDLDDEEEYDEEEEEDDDDRPRKKPRHGGFILDEAGRARPASLFTSPVTCQR